jgi:hypothetical protein
MIVAARAAAPRPTHQAGVVKRCLVSAFGGRYLAYIVRPHITILFDSNVRIATHLWAFGLTVLTAMATTITSNAILMTPLGHAVHQHAPPSNTPNHSATPNQAHATNVPPSSTHNAMVASAQTTTRQVVPAAGSTPVSTKKKSYCIRWSPVNKCMVVSGLVLVLIALIAQLYSTIMSRPGSLADRRAIWSSYNDFRATCISELESELSLSPSCNKTLAQPAELPPGLQKRDVIKVSAYLVQGMVAVVVASVVSALVYAATQFFDTLQLTTVTWNTFDMNGGNTLDGMNRIERKFERPETTLVSSSDLITRVRQKFLSPETSSEYRLRSTRVLMLHMPSKISIPDKRTASQHAAVVHWKQLCQLSKKPGTHTIKVPLLSASDTQRLSLRQINPKLRGPDSTSTDIDSDSASFPASAAFYGSFESEICEYPTVYFLIDDAESIDRVGSDRGYLYVLLNSDLLDYGPTLDYEQNVFKGLSARGKARVQYGDRINSPDFFGGGPDLQERRRYKGFWD